MGVELGAPLRMTRSGAEVLVELELDAAVMLKRLSEQYVHLLVLDLRSEREEAPDAATLQRTFDLLDRVDRPEDIELRYGFHRILALVGGDGEQTDDVIARLGARGVGRVLREPPSSNDRERFAERVLDEIAAQVVDRRAGKTALAASGGGITGIYFEVGAMKCLDDCLTPDTGALDMYFGISAGAVVTGIVAAGYSIDELMAAIAGREGGRIPRLDLRLFRIGLLNYADMARRLGAATDIVWHALYDLVWHKSLLSLNDLFLDFTSLIGPPFRADRFERVLAGLFERCGATNDFSRLKRPLYIGASDQDARRHVLFGADGHRHTPISKAIQGSLSVNPAFGAVQIDGRYYEDGAVTRTSNFTEAITRGSDLIFIVDPFLPYVSRVAGDSDRQGVLYNVDQDLRTMSYTRFENVRYWVLRRHPHVSTYTFLPSNRVRRLLTLNPMDHRPFLAIWRGAYLSTFERIRRLEHRLRGDLAAHGMKLDLERAAVVADQLERSVTPAFEDFYPEGKVAIRTPPLSLARAASAPQRATRAAQVASASNSGVEA
jgi:NTE family protein